MKVDIYDLGLRFIFGGLAVAACYIVLQLVPSKSFAGIFAAFPAVMAAAVIMAGHFGSSEQAADIAFGASAGMMGCTVCVFVASFCMQHVGKWGLSLVIALMAWLVSSFMFIQLMHCFLEKRGRQV
ncbi:MULTISPECIES: DUF3147 family protein [unclassified Methanosarcina]|uniref:DUF3147 family protein n=1 Tax=unclassified Methanosarcina TaxID=2644672 RepID=UPI00061572D0|nr:MULTISPECIES: DUF3147 family protein [unclassified Methanosarcina]AKB18276.1 hypothetical protein MSWHS_1413 [Methanosarcina sp. WWM596]AKB21600.1 hypothetical protein MSWH1_1329 [Methanosarcina sp. WH1]